MMMFIQREIMMMFTHKTFYYDVYLIDYNMNSKQILPLRTKKTKKQ